MYESSLLYFTLQCTRCSAISIQCTYFFVIYFLGLEITDVWKRLFEIGILRRTRVWKGCSFQVPGGLGINKYSDSCVKQRLIVANMRYFDSMPLFKSVLLLSRRTKNNVFQSYPTISDDRNLDVWEKFWIQQEIMMENMRTRSGTENYKTYIHYTHTAKL